METPEIIPTTENTIHPPEGKVFNERQLYLGSFLGGPFAIAYFLSQNFKLFKEDKKAMLTWVITIVFSAVLLAILFSLPDNSSTIGDRAIPLVYTLVSIVIYNVTQKDKVATHINSGGALQSWGKTILVSIISVLLFLGVIFGYVFLDDAASQGLKTYGKVNNQVYYNKGTITNTDVDKIAHILEETGYFDDDVQVGINLDRVDKTLEVSCYVNQEAWNDPEAITYYTLLKEQLQNQLLPEKVVLKLTDAETGDVKKKLE
jgi:hypothetical protein